MNWLTYKKIFLIFHILALEACVQGSLSINSKPDGSEVILVSTTGQAKTIGKTPVRLQWHDAFVDSADMTQVLIRQDGYQNSYVLVPKPYFKHNIELNLVLEKQIDCSDASKGSMNPQLSCDLLTHEQMNRLGRGIATSQASIVNQDYEVARSKLEQLISEFPYVSVLFDLRGNTYYLQKQFSQALEAYEESLRLNPGNMETMVMVRRLKEITGKADSR
ncbi:MAG: tetratricopeptide repeat protein [Oligoflexus sp.]